MSQKHRPFLNWQLVTAAIAVFLLANGWQPALAQGPTFDTKIVGGPSRSPNPKVIVKYITVASRDDRAKPPSAVTTKLSASDEKRREIEQAIDNGNHARDMDQYADAITSYERVTKELDPKDARAHYGLGNVYSDLSCADSAIGEYLEALRLKKDSHDALIALGYAYAIKERYDEAEQRFNEALRTTPNDVGAKIGLAFVLAKRKKYEDAVKQLILIADNQSIGEQDRAIAHLVLGDVYSLEQDYESESQQEKAAIKLNPELARAYLNLGMAELLPAMKKFGARFAVQDFRPEDRATLNTIARQATEHFRQAIYEHHFNHPSAYIYLAYGLAWQYRFGEAESTLKTYLTKIKELEDGISSLAKTKTCDYGFAALYANGYRQLGFLYQTESQYETDNQKKNEWLNKSKESFEQVLRVKEDDANAYNFLGNIYFSQGKYREAIEQLEKAVSYEASDANKASTYGTLGLAYLSMGRTNDAIDTLKKAILIQPDNAGNYSTLALIYGRVGRFDEAILLVKKAMDRTGATPDSYWSLASLYFRKARKEGAEADYEEAIRLLNEALKINQSYAVAYLSLGNVYKFYKKGTMIDKAVANYELAAKYDEKNPLIYFNLGDLYSGINDDASIFNLKKAIELKPEYNDARWELALEYGRKHDDAEAIKQLLETIKYDDKYLDAYLSLAGIYRTEKNYPEAAKYLSKARGFAPTDYRMYKELAKLSEAQGQSNDAVGYYEEAIKHLEPSDAFGKELYLCRIERLRDQYPAAIACFQKIKVPQSEDPGVSIYDIGLTYIAMRNKKDALGQYEQLKALKSSLADDLLRQINEMK